MKKNILRGKILSFLRDIFPDGADGLTVVSVFYQYHRDEDIRESLAYLEAKEYVSRKDLPHPYKPREVVSLYKISPQGIDLVDGNIGNDPGIILPPKEG